MQTKSEKMLPKTADEITNGGIYIQRVRCGKSNCKCARGETHSAYYFFTRRRGKLLKIYVRKAEVEEFISLIDQAIEDRKLHRQASKSNFLLLKQLRQNLREKTLLINSPYAEMNLV